MKDWVDKVQIWGGEGSVWVDSPQTARRLTLCPPPEPRDRTAIAGRTGRGDPGTCPV